MLISIKHVVHYFMQLNVLFHRIVFSYNQIKDLIKKNRMYFVLSCHPLYCLAVAVVNAIIEMQVHKGATLSVLARR